MLLHTPGSARGVSQVEHVPAGQSYSSSPSATVDGALTLLNDFVDLTLFWLIDLAVTVDAEPPSSSSWLSTSESDLASSSRRFLSASCVHEN